MTDAEEFAASLAELRQERGIAVVYHGPDGDILLEKAIKRKKNWRFDDENMLSQHVETDDFIFAVADFTGFERDVFEPTAGTQVSVEVGSTHLDWFEVVSVNKERVWEFSDETGQTTIRMHTLFRRREAI